VLPLVIIVVVLVAIVFYFAHRMRIARKKTKNIIDTYIKEKSKMSQHVNRELEKLKKLLENNSIDEETYERLKQVLLASYKEKRGDSDDLVSYVSEKKE